MTIFPLAAIFFSALASPVGASLSDPHQQPTKPSLRGLKNTSPPSYSGLAPVSNCNTAPAWADANIGWSDLTTDQLSAAVFLGYTESIWSIRLAGDDSEELASFNEDYADKEWTDLTPPQQVAFVYLGENAGTYSGFYSDYDFDELPARAQAAANAVGYTQDVWDNCLAGDYYADKEWTDLTPPQQVAFVYLGENAGTYSGFYSDYDFDELPASAQAAANAVGYTQDVWDNCVAGELCNAQMDNMRWRGLSKLQRTNLKVLGYSCWVWDKYDPDAEVWKAKKPPTYLGLPPSATCSTSPAWADESLGWKGLTTDQLNAAKFLGYEEKTWNAAPAYFDGKEWADLIPAQQIAFAYLGYNSGSFSDFYNDYWFAEMPSEVQVAANAVGYTQNIWDNCAAETCSAQVDSKEWKFLSLMQRNNLKVLGYDCWTWSN
eukprot:CAMPEP_0185826560 /NCGR_PEP_ID=MMETSP1322-20130828/31605_1 /TAXON_ID=265543 /ORGANISM="Minutocellus polymorphus, Strain RCC2270" /LENGTH=431 /DNA_ID=CAMNT_0028524289 /DNA_START=227 /DNA_END=1526 /DNA_ORIENTATION=+